MIFIKISNVMRFIFSAVHAGFLTGLTMTLPTMLQYNKISMQNIRLCILLFACMCLIHKNYAFKRCQSWAGDINASNVKIHIYFGGYIQ